MMNGPQPFQFNFNDPSWQMGPQQQQNSLAQILQQRQQQGAQQQAPMQQSQIQPMQAPQQQQAGGGMQDIAGMMGWKPDANATPWDNKMAAFSHIFSTLGL